MRALNVLSMIVVLALAITSLASLRAQTLRTLTASGQGQVANRSLCGGAPIFKPPTLPSSSSGSVVFLIAICFEPAGYQSPFPPEKYLHEIHLRASRPSQGEWTPYDENAERAIFEDYRRLWDNNSLAGLSIDIRDYRFANGVIGKIVSYHITERS
jgi:hypothetical protein